MNLTVNERILLHLLQQGQQDSTFNVQFAMTQDGIADGIGIRRSHVPRSISKLLREGLVEEKLAHILQVKRRRKAYFLTPRGLARSESLRKDLLGMDVEYIEPSGQKRRGRMDEALRSLKLPLVQALRIAAEKGVITPVVGGQPVPMTAPPDEVPEETLYGRVQEVRSLERLVREARMIGRLLLITGEAGVGKSVLSHKAAALAEREGLQSATARCPSVEGLDPYLPLWDALRSLEETVPELGGQLASLRKGISRKGTTSPDETVPGEAAPGEAGGEDLLFERLREALLSALGDSPLCLVLEDIHWAQPPLLRLVKYLSQRLPRGMIVLTIREGPEPKNAELEAFRSNAARERTALEISLKGLDIDGLRQLSAKVRPGLAEAHLRQLHELTQGNPFFAVEMLQSGFPERKEIPRGIRELLAERIDSLSALHRACVETAALMGREPDLEVLEAAVGAPEEEFIQMVEALFEKGVFREMPDGGTCAFRHPLIQEVAYASLPQARLAEKHQRLGQLYEEVYVDRIGEHLFELAYHFLKGRDPERGPHYARMCAERCQEMMAFPEAVSYIQSALTLLHPVRYRGERVALLEELGELYYLAGRFDDAAESFRMVVRERGDEAWDVYRKLAGTYIRLNRGEEALALYQRIVDDPRADVEVRVRTYADIANLKLKRGEPEKALDAASRALELGRELDDDSERAHAEFIVGVAHWMNGQPAEGIVHIERSLKVREQFDNPVELAHTYNTLGMVLKDAGRLDQAMEALRRALELKERVRDPFGRLAALNNIALVHHSRREFAKALEIFMGVVEEGQKMGDRVLVMGAASNIGSLMMEMNRIGEALEYFRKALELAREASDRRAEANAHYNLACALRSLGRVDEALEELALAARSAYDELQGLGFELARCELAIATGADVSRELSRAMTEAERRGVRHLVVWGARLQATMERKRGRLKESVDQALESLAMAKEVDSPSEEAACHLEAALGLREMKRAAEAVKHAKSSIRLFRVAGQEAAARKVLEEFPDLKD